MRSVHQSRNRRSVGYYVEPLENRLLLSVEQLDPRFGTGGSDTIGGFAGTWYSTAMQALQQPDGKTLIVGSALGGVSDNVVALARINADASPDASFGAGGTVLTRFACAQNAPESVCIQPDGKIVVATTSASKGFEVLRFNADGTPDTTFNGSGQFTTTVADSDMVYTVAVAPGGSIVAAGSSSTSANYAAIRLTPGGTLDPTFNGTGELVLTGRTSNAGQITYYSIQSIAFQADSKIVFAAASHYFTASRPGGIGVLIRVNPDGSVDSGFGNNGIVTAPPEGGYAASIMALQVQSDGTILTAGSPTSQPTSIGMFSFNSDGTLDSTFGSHGYAASASLGTSLNASLWSFGFAPDGRVIAAGSYQANSVDLLVARSLPNGALDTTFNNTGYALVPAYNTPLIYGVSAGGDGSVDVASSLVQNALGMEVVRLKAQGTLDGNFAGGIDHVSVAGPDDARFMRAWELPDHEVVATGWVDNAGDNVTRALAARYEPDGSRDPSFGVDGIVEFPSYGADHPEVVLPLPDGQFLLAGVRVIGPTQPQELMLMRVNADGSLDTTFGSGGITADQVSGGYSEQVTDLTLDPAGNIVVVGLSTSYYGVSSTMIARYLPGGAPDSSFGTNGSTTVLPESYPRENWPQRVGVAESGDIVVIDTLNWAASAPITSDFGVLRLLSDGTLDPNFGSGGLVSTDFGGKDDFPQALLLNPDGTIVVAGEVNVAPGGAPSLEGDYGIIRYLPSGAPDPSFGSGGAVIGIVDNTASGVLNLTSQSNGAILAGGTVGRQPFQMRLNPAGSLDPTFGNGGLAVADTTAGDSVPWYIPPGDVLGLSSGQMVAVGQTLSGVVGQDGVASATIARYLTAPGPVAVLGRDYAIPADGSITLSAGNSFDNDGTIASYEWDMNYNGVSFNTDATGISAVASDAGLTAGDTKTVALRVTDNLGYTDLTTATLTVVPSDVINAPTGSPTIVLAAGDDTQHVRWSMGGTSGQVAVQDPKGLTIDGGPATISLDYTGGNPLPAILHLNGTFTIDGFQNLSGTTLDLGRSTLFVNYAGSSDPLPLIQRYLQTGYNGGAWNGWGGAAGGTITTSAGSSLFGIGYADVADSSGTNPVANTIELKFTVAGDTNLDGTVNLADFSTLVRHFGHVAGWDAGDLNYDGTTNLADLLMLVRHVGQSLPPTLSANDLSSPAEDAARRRLAIRRP